MSAERYIPPSRRTEKARPEESFEEYQERISNKSRSSKHEKPTVSSNVDLSTVNVGKKTSTFSLLEFMSSSDREKVIGNTTTKQPEELQPDKEEKASDTDKYVPPWKRQKEEEYVDDRKNSFYKTNRTNNPWSSRKETYVEISSKEAEHFEDISACTHSAKTNLYSEWVKKETIEDILSMPI